MRNTGRRRWGISERLRRRMPVRGHLRPGGGPSQRPWRRRNPNRGSSRMAFLQWFQSHLRRRRSRGRRYGRPRRRPRPRRGLVLVVQLQQQRKRRRPRQRRRRQRPLVSSLVALDPLRLSSLSPSPRECSKISTMTTTTISTTLLEAAILPNSATSGGTYSICCTATSTATSAPTRPPSTTSRQHRKWRRARCRRPRPEAGRRRYHR
mmetsp:Transcript_21653/g.62136  ORF Transcript_21653/g.62136 Transcript_21653/m.62136 type:complete len:207 (-) Transcript_21653:104-724(-)